MSDGNKPAIGPTSGSRDAARRKGQAFFSSSEAREDAFRAEVERERKATDAKTLKLRALRLAKEEEDRIAAENAPQPVKKSRAKKETPPTA